MKLYLGLITWGNIWIIKIYSILEKVGAVTREMELLLMVKDIIYLKWTVQDLYLKHMKAMKVMTEKDWLRFLILSCTDVVDKNLRV